MVWYVVAEVGAVRAIEHVIGPSAVRELDVHPKCLAPDPCCLGLILKPFTRRASSPTIGLALVHCHASRGACSIT
jgi:hypothetical protein